MMQIRRSFVVFFTALRRSLRALALSALLLTSLLFFISPKLLHLMQAHLGEKLYFFSVAEPFLAHVKLSFLGAIYVLMPFFLHVLWKALAQAFSIPLRQRLWFVVTTCALFYGGSLFCYLLTLPFGVQFLLGFQDAHLQAVISINRFVNFVTLFVLAFGLVFELPIFMIFSAKAGLISRRSFIRHRRYAILAIAIAAALLTPTPDVVNMALMGLPLYLLYESGILLIGFLKLDQDRQRNRALHIR